MKNAVKIAILDSGINVNHDYLKNSIKTGYSFVKSDENYRIIEGNYCDDFGHGTICASAIKKECKDIKFYIYKVLDKEGKGNLNILETALKSLIGSDIDIINMSLAVMNETVIEDLDNICKRLESENKILVCSPSNRSERSYPACLESVIGVKAKLMKKKDEFWFNRNKEVQAVVDSIPYLHCDLNNKYQINGHSNSFSAAKFTGVIARILSENNGMKKDDLINTLEKISVKHNWTEADLDEDFNIFRVQYEGDKSIREFVEKKLMEFLNIHDKSILYNYDLYSLEVGFYDEKCYEFLRILEDYFYFNIEDYTNVSFYDLNSINGLVSLIERNINDK